MKPHKPIFFFIIFIDLLIYLLIITFVDICVYHVSLKRASLNDLAAKLREHVRNAMLYLRSLLIAVLRSLDTEANRFYDRNHQIYDAALLTRCYTQHALCLFIDSNLIIYGISLKFRSLIKELILLIYQVYSRTNQCHSLYLRTSKTRNLLLYVTNIINQSEILFLISIYLFLILIFMLLLLSLEIVKI